MAKEETITIKKESLWKYSTFILAAILIIGAFVFFNNSNTDSTNTAGTQQGQQIPSTTGKVSVSVDDDAVLGDKNAKVTIIEFSDYQCPFCRKFWSETYSQLKKDYIDTGKVKLVFRDFPLSFHPMAQSSAEAAECVREVGKSDEAYWKMHDKIFEEQMVLDGGTVKSTVTFTTTDLKTWAKEIGYNIDSCLDSGKYTQEVQKDFADGGASGVQGTPAFFVNGKFLEGAQPYATFQQTIDALLK